MDSVIKWLEEYKFIAQIRSSSADDAENMIKAAIDGGIRLFEISAYTPQAMRLIENYSKKENILVGAGNLTDGETAHKALQSGAKFVASLYFDLEIINVAKHSESFVIQGAMTPTEALEAHKQGADLIKVYPADAVGGIDFLRTLKTGFPFLKFVADHGISFDNAFDYLKHSTAVVLRSTIFDRLLLRTNNWSGITERARQFTERLEGQKTRQPA